MIGLDGSYTKDSKSDSEERSSSPNKGGPFVLCARHDFTIGSQLLEVEPYQHHPDDPVIIYIRLVELDSGDPRWAGSVVLEGGAVVEASVYGGSPYAFESHTEEVDSA